jgi:hypothetical protein
MNKERNSILRRLREDLNYTIRSGPTTLGFELSYLDLSSWKLRLSERTPVVWVKSADLEKREPQHLVDSLQDVVRAHGLRHDPLLALVDGDGRPLRDHTSRLQNHAHIVIIDRENQEDILYSRRPTGVLRDLISAQLSISLLAPYETAAPVVGSRFFGRDYEIARILENPDTNHIILGIRRIGKTSLLKEIERRLRENEEDKEHDHIIYLDCSDLFSTDDYIREVVRKLNHRELPRLHLQQYAFFFPDFLERMARRYHRKIIFLLDEIDNLIIMQRGFWELFRMLRASANKGFCQYIMAGFREAMVEQASLESPFFNFAQEVRLNEFKLKQAQELIVTPMENLGVHFRNKEGVVGQIYEETAGHPNLIQYYCTILLRSLDLDQMGRREIGLDNLIDVYNDEGFKRYLMTSFMENTRNREKALVYAVLLQINGGRLGGFSQSAMDAALRKQGIVLPQNMLNAACEVLKLAGIFDQRGKDYFFTSPVFAKVLLQSYDVLHLLVKAKEEGI